MWWSLLLSLLTTLVKWLLDEYTAGRKLSEKDSKRLAQVLGKMKQAQTISRERFGVWPEENPSDT